MIERGSNGLWTEQEVAACIEDTFRIMSYLGIREEPFGIIRQMEINEAVYEKAEADGFWYPEITAGKKVCSGDCLGYFQKYPDEKRIEIRAKFDGVVLYYTTSMGVSVGESLVAYGRDTH